jgi:RNA polymerase sigma-70 factor (ECF subfamily)
LVMQARSDTAAFVQLYRRHYDTVFRYCVHRLFDRQTAEDVTSQVFLNIVEKFGQFKGNQQQFRNWLYKIATNAINDHLRRTARRNRLLKYAREQTGNRVANCQSQPGSSDEKLALLKEGMLSLKPRYQTIITLHFFEKLKLTEIAEVLACSPGTVRSQLSRALAKLKAKMSTGGTA